MPISHPAPPAFVFHRSAPISGYITPSHSPPSMAPTGSYLNPSLSSLKLPKHQPPLTMLSRSRPAPYLSPVRVKTTLSGSIRTHIASLNKLSDTPIFPLPSSTFSDVCFGENGRRACYPLKVWPYPAIRTRASKAWPWKWRHQIPPPPMRSLPNGGRARSSNSSRRL